MSKPALDPSRFRLKGEVPHTGLAPECLQGAYGAWSALEEAVAAKDADTAGPALWLTLNRLEGAWLEIADDPVGAAWAMLLLSAAPQALEWLASEHYSPEGVARLGEMYSRLQLASLHASGNA